jgi:molybdopterin synthase catalytic subunit
MRCELTRLPIVPAALVDAVAHGGAGAVDVFYGMVRDNAAGQTVVALEYSAYDAMALREMQSIVAELEAKHAGVRLAVTHRLGQLAVGELAVVCAASAPHRGEAFTACRDLIDEIKHRVPIWKREYGPTGPYWVGWRDARCGGMHDDPAPLPANTDEVNATKP